MALAINPALVVENVDQTVKAVLEMRRPFGRKGFLDAYCTRTRKRTLSSLWVWPASASTTICSTADFNEP